MSETKMATNTLYDAQLKLLNERLTQLETRSTITEKTVGDAYWEGRRDEHDCMLTKLDEKHSEGFCWGLFVGLFVSLFAYVIIKYCTSSNSIAK